MKISASFITMCAQIQNTHAVLIWSTATVFLCIRFCSVVRPHCFLFFPAEVKTFSLCCKQNYSWKIILFTQKCFPAFTLGEQKAVSSVKDLDWMRDFWRESTAVLRLVSCTPFQWLVHTAWWVCAGAPLLPYSVVSVSTRMTITINV